MIVKKEDNPIFVRLSVCYTIVEKNELKEKKKQKLSGRAFIWSSVACSEVFVDFFFDNTIIRLEMSFLESNRDQSVSSTATIANQSILESCATSQNHSKFDIHADGQIWNRSAKSSRFLPQNSIEKFWIPNFSSRPLNLKNDQVLENVSGQEKSESLLKKSCTVSHRRF